MALCALIPNALLKRSLPLPPFPEISIWSGTDALAVLHESADALFLARHPHNRFSLGRVPPEAPERLTQALTRCGVPDCVTLIEDMEAASHRALLLRILHQSLDAAGVPVISGLPPGAGAAPADYATLCAMAGSILVGLCASQVLPDTIVPQTLLAGPPPRSAPDRSIYEHGKVLHLASHPKIRIAQAGKVVALLAGSEVRVTADLVHDVFRADLVLPDWCDGSIIQDVAGHHVLTRTRLFLSPEDAAHFALGRSARHDAWIRVPEPAPQPDRAS